MNSTRYLLMFLFLCIVLIISDLAVHAIPATDFTLRSGDWHDNWDIDRNYYGGTYGYLPNIASETLNENRELAYSIGEQFRDDYSSELERATAILKYVQTWTEYGYDSDNVIRNGVAQEEWAWNADEMAHNFSETTGAIAIGDCEDLAFLCGTIYLGAGFDAAVVDAPEHVGLLIWLPEYPNADNYWDIPNDGRGSGWIWVESTGSSNPLGWTPPDFDKGDWTAYPLVALAPVTEPPQTFVLDLPLDLIIVIAVVVIILLAVGVGASAGRKRDPPIQYYWPPPPP